MNERRILANIVGRLVAPIAQRVRLMVSRGVVELVNDSLKCQGLQVSLLADELRDDVEHFQEYGFTSVPFVGAEVLFLSVGGNRAHGIAACVTDRRHRPKELNEGDTCLYTDKGERVYLDRDNDIVNLGDKSAADWVALAAATKSEITALRNTVNTHVGTPGTYVTHTHPVPVGGFSGPPVQPPTSPATVGDVKATKVKAT